MMYKKKIMAVSMIQNYGATESQICSGGVEEWRGGGGKDHELSHAAVI
jgi:hypothetical protein